MSRDWCQRQTKPVIKIVWKNETLFRNRSTSGPTPDYGARDVSHEYIFSTKLYHQKSLLVDISLKKFFLWNKLFLNQWDQPYWQRRIKAVWHHRSGIGDSFVFPYLIKFGKIHTENFQNQYCVLGNVSSPSRCYLLPDLCKVYDP